MPLTSLRNLLLPGLLLASLAGCGTNHSACFDNMDYQTAINRPRLQMPEGVPGSERLAPLAIPTVGETTKLEPQPRCIDEPPSYFGRKGAVADPAEEVVNAWARAWAEKRADAVVGLYSSTFEATGEGGSAAYIDQRRQQVTTGRSPAAVLEDMSVTTVSGDKRVVTFVQRFGDDRVRKELTLVHEPLGWRIVAERTLEVL